MKTKSDQVLWISDTGNADFEDYKICLKWKKRLSGIRYCFDAYKNPKGSTETGDEYLAVMDVGIFPGTIEK